MKKSSASIRLANKIKVASQKLKDLREEMKALKTKEATQGSLVANSKKPAVKTNAKKALKKNIKNIKNQPALKRKKKSS